MKRLEKLLSEIENHISRQHIINAPVSKSPVGWHIEHMLITINLIIDQLKISDPDQYHWKFSFWRYYVFTTNKIPRGKAKAPKVVRPQNSFTETTLMKHLEDTRKNIKHLAALPPKAYFTHPFFGKLKLNPAIKFLGIHTRHHLKIINDIIEEQDPQQ